MSVTITATATGSLCPPIVDPDGVQNGDFSITSNPGSIQPAGDGINEFTRWTFNFTGHPDFKTFLETEEALTSARLTLVLEPRNVRFDTDSVTIDVEEPYRRIIDFPKLPVGRANIMQLDLVRDEKGFYTPKEIRDILSRDFDEGSGRIPMAYEEDAFICFAQLELTR